MTGSTDTEIIVVDTPKELALDVARHISRLALTCIESTGRFAISLSGGSTPKALYEILAAPPFKDEMPWEDIFFFFGDERCVAHDSDESNFRMASEAMLKRAPIPPENVFSTERQDTSPEQSASLYEKKLQEFFSLKEGQFPVFDLILLGLGDDGHTASLFPESKALSESKRLCVANYVEKFKTSRITMTLPVLNNAAQVAFLVTGAAKAPIVSDILTGKKERAYPAMLIGPHNGTVKWYLDKAAASELDAALCCP